MLHDNAHDDNTNSKSTTSICEDCNKKTQKEVPLYSTAMNVCAQDYQQVAHCMKENNDQISQCVQEWAAFRACHAANPQR